MWILTLACSVSLGWMTLYCCLFFPSPFSLPANLPSFSQSFGCKTASHFVEFLCRINICNCKALGWHLYLKGREGVTGSNGCSLDANTLRALMHTGWTSFEVDAGGITTVQITFLPFCLEEDWPSWDTHLYAAWLPACRQRGS